MPPDPHPLSPRRRWLVPEVMQTSALDCGPAALKSVFEGFGVRVDYGRLRAILQTDIDGTSIDTLEEVAQDLGLEAQQLVLPPDFVTGRHASSLPAIVVKRLPNGHCHFVVAWSQHGGVVQVMDPSSGRQWMSTRTLQRELFIHDQPVDEMLWRALAESEVFLDPLRSRLRALGIRNEAELVAEALADPSWRTMAALDASARMVALLVESRAMRAGIHAERLLRDTLRRALEQETLDELAAVLPRQCWSVWPEGEDLEPGQIMMIGAVLVKLERGAGVALDDSMLPDRARSGLRASLEDQTPSPTAQLLAFLRLGGMLQPLVLLPMLVLLTAGLVVEAILLRGALSIGGELALGSQRMLAAAALLALGALVLVLSTSVARVVLRIGRHLEMRFRLAFLQKIPRLGDRYFRTRLVSDLAERGHSAHRVRALSRVAQRLTTTQLELVLTTAAIAFIDIASLFAAALAVVVAIALPLALRAPVAERDFRVRAHAGALSRYYLDALLGLVTIRAHGAERAVAREQGIKLTEWGRASYSLLRVVLGQELVQLVGGTLCVAWLVIGYVMRSPEPHGVLLIAYWGLRLPLLAEDVVHQVTQYRHLHNAVRRLLEPIAAPEEDEGTELASVEPGRRGLPIRLRDVSVVEGGHLILQGVSLEIRAGEHVAVIGRSGAGKSTLAGLLLGWSPPATGTVEIGGVSVDALDEHALRSQIAWVDPSVQLWNRSLVANVRYGSRGSDAPLASCIQQADLLSVLEKLPDGMQTTLGEGGGLLSGGEGQRVRLARAFARKDARLVVLDEAFRGLDRDQRRSMLARARRLWEEATLVFITHDVGETRGLDRVVVVEDGEVVEHGPPARLLERPGSRYRAMLDEEDAARSEVWGDPRWRRIQVESGRVLEPARSAAR